MKNKKIEFKLEEELYNRYRNFCEENGYDMSKRLRLFIENELKKEIIYDYDDEMKNIRTESENKVKSISLLYFDIDSVERQNNYFKLKEEDFILGLTNLKFLLKTSKKVLSNLSNQDFTNFNIVNDTLSNIKKLMDNINDYYNEINNFFYKLKADIKKV